MKIIHQDITLRTIEQADIERIRGWRNDESVNKYLKTRKEISAGEQIEWFNSRDPKTSIYFMMEHVCVPFGLIYVDSINLEEMSFEGSIFTGDSDYMNSHLPVKAIMMLFVLFFEHLHFELLYSRVHYKNAAAVEINRHLGFKDLRREGELIFSRCTKSDFESKSASLKKTLLREIPIEITIDNRDEKYGFAKTLFDA